MEDANFVLSTVRLFEAFRLVEVLAVRNGVPGSAMLRIVYESILVVRWSRTVVAVDSLVCKYCEQGSVG